jgi:hypothetical protein
MHVKRREGEFQNETHTQSSRRCRSAFQKDTIHIHIYRAESGSAKRSSLPKNCIHEQEQAVDGTQMQTI